MTQLQVIPSSLCVSVCKWIYRLLKAMASDCASQCQSFFLINLRNSSLRLCRDHLTPSEVISHVITHCTLILCCTWQRAQQFRCNARLWKIAAWPTTRISSVDPAQKVKTPWTIASTEAVSMSLGGSEMRVVRHFIIRPFYRLLPWPALSANYWAVVGEV